MRYNNRRRYDDDDRFSGDYEDTIGHRVAGLVVLGLGVALLVGVCKGIEWLIHNI